MVVLDYLKTAWQAPGAAELNRKTLWVTRPFGIVAVAYARVARPGSPIRPEGLLGARCIEWGEAYVRERCARTDPAVERIFAAAGPFTWTSLRGAGLSPAQERVFTIAAEFGFRDGVVTPVLGGQGEVGAVIFLSDRRLELQPGDESILGAIATLYAARGAALVGERRATGPIRLSARERQCLAWSARGKSDSLTSQILDLSEKTVRMHVENARRKLGVHTRAQAISEAWRQGWLVDDVQ